MENYEAAIYGLRCECGCDKPQIRYVGLTTQPLSTRLTNHRGMARFGARTPVYNWIRKHGPENIRIDPLKVTTPDAMDSDEIEMIASTPGLLNISPGGEGGAFRGKKRPDHSLLVRGEGHHSAILTEKDVIEARSEYTGKYGQITALARRYGVTVQTMEGALKGKSWRHI